MVKRQDNAICKQIDNFEMSGRIKQGDGLNDFIVYTDNG